MSEYEDALESPSNLDMPSLADKTANVKKATSDFTATINSNAESKQILDAIGKVFVAMNERDEAIVEQISKCTDFVTDEMQYMRGELDKVRNCDAIEELKVVDNCRSDLKKVWLRFTYRQEAINIRDAGNFPSQVLRLLSSMNINFSNGLLPIESAFLQNKKFDGAPVPEITICCSFVSVVYARKVKSGVAAFNKALIDSGHADDIRYRTHVSWSANVWGIFRILMELKEHKLITNHFITMEGLKAAFEETDAADEGVKTRTVTVNSFSQLDSLRKTVKDFYASAPAKNIYNLDYFKCTSEEKKTLREAEIIDDPDMTVVDVDDNITPSLSQNA
jgi:hypothetical protein